MNCCRFQWKNVHAVLAATKNACRPSSFDNLSIFSVSLTINMSNNRISSHETLFSHHQVRGYSILCYICVQFRFYVREPVKYTTSPRNRLPTTATQPPHGIGCQQLLETGSVDLCSSNWNHEMLMSLLHQLSNQ